MQVKETSILDVSFTFQQSLFMLMREYFYRNKCYYFIINIFLVWVKPSDFNS